MVFAKTELFEVELQQSAELFKALAHPARLAILKYLAESGQCINGDFTEELPLSRTTVSQHLAELKAVGLIESHASGNKTLYCLNVENVKKMDAILSQFIGSIVSSNGCCKKC